MYTCADLQEKNTLNSGRGETRHYRVTDGEIIAGHYVGSRLGGRGSSASVFAAKSTILGGADDMDDNGAPPELIPAHPFALKIYRDDSFDMDTFKNEVRTLMYLTGVDVVPQMIGTGAAVSMSGGETRIHPWILFPYAGVALSEFIERAGRLDRATATGIMRKLSAGLAAIHAAGVIHADINPHNVMLLGDEIKIIDFGASAAGGVHFRRMPGTRMYSAPEVICAFDYDAKIDIWSAGVTCFQMFTGIVPFDYFGDFGVVYSADEKAVGNSCGDNCGSCSADDMSDDSAAKSSNDSTSEDEIPPDEHAETMEHLAVMYKVLSAPDPQPANFTIAPVPTPLGLAQLVLLNTDLEIDDAWYISDLITPLLEIRSDLRPAVVIKN